jgi:hypothetical protein
MEEFNEQKLLARYKTGFKGGPFFKWPASISRTISGGYPSESVQKIHGDSIPKMTPTDPWFGRRNS